MNISKTILAGIALLMLGSFFLFLENSFYNYVDENGVLQESLSLLLGSLSLSLGIITILFFCTKKLLNFVVFSIKAKLSKN